MKLRDAINRVFRDETYYDWEGFAQRLTFFELFAIIFICGVGLYFFASIVGAP